MNNSLQQEYKDFFGKEIQVGDYIVYALSSQHHAFIKAGKILELTDNERGEPRIKVLGLEHQRWSKTYRVSKSTVQYFNKMVVVDKSIIPADMLLLLQ